MKRKMFLSAVLAGIAIGCGGFAYMALGGAKGPAAGVIPAVAFTFGLLTVIHYRLRLYTGYVGFMDIRKESGFSLLILAGNMVGCVLMAMLARLSPLPIAENAGVVLSARLATGPLRCGLLAIGCGFIVTTAVEFGRKDKWLPVLFGVPCFIICGFPHCIADPFYYFAAPWSIWDGNCLRILLVWVSIVAGNFVGCNLYRAMHLQ